MKDIEALREVETAWLADQLGRAIANLGYPVGMGVRPRQAALNFAAKTLFDRYAKMIEMAAVNSETRLANDRADHGKGI